MLSVKSKVCECEFSYYEQDGVYLLSFTDLKGEVVNYMSISFCPKCGKDLSEVSSNPLVDGIVKEIIRRVKENNMPLEDGEFTIDGSVYTTHEVSGNWSCSFMGRYFNWYDRNVMCEVRGKGIESRVIISQYQTRKVEVGSNKVSYQYGDIAKNGI